MRVVIALGGNALSPPKKDVNYTELAAHIGETAKTLTELVKQGWELAIVFGSGPQVGALLLKEDIAKQGVPMMPLDVLDAEVQGQLGYLIAQSLQNELQRQKLHVPVASLLTQVVVDNSDPAFTNPTKPVGPIYSQKETARLEKEGWRIQEDAGRGFRRVVPSPQPLRIVEAETIRQLVESGTIIIAAGGGGIPVIEEGGRLTGVEAVIDKDRAAALLAAAIRADFLLIITSIDAVYLNYGTNQQTPIRKMTTTEAERYLHAGHFAEGSMKPKIEAALAFLRNGGKQVMITDEKHILKTLAGKSGTTMGHAIALRKGGKRRRQ